MTHRLPPFRLLPPALLLAGCAAVPDLGPEPVPRAPETIEAQRSLPTAPGASLPTDAWWTAYGDPQLEALVREGLRNSPDVAAALARVRRAGGLAQQAGAATLPSLDASGRAGYDRQSLNMGYPDEFKTILPKGWQQSAQAAVSLNFDLDLWGKNRAALAAARSEERAALVDARQAQMMLSTAIASAYYDLGLLQATRDVRQATLDSRLASRKLIAERQANGLDTRGTQSQSEAEAATARVDLGAVDQAIGVRRHQIAALLGAGPDRGLAVTPPRLGDTAVRPLPEGVTTDLIGRRPDIVAARERVEAAASRIKVARADFFPALRLSALIGVQALGFDNLIDKQSVYGNAGPAISLPIFHGGAIRGAYRGARANYDEAVADYDKVVVGAYQEVADAVTAAQLIAQRLADARTALAASEHSYSVARDRYRIGLSNYLDVLIVEDRLLQARLNAATLEGAARSADISLIRALGGGFADRYPDKDASHG